MSEFFGRTNLRLPEIWLSLAVPKDPADGWLDQLVGAALATDAPIDISSSPGLWGGAMRGTDATLMSFGVDPADFLSHEVAVNQTQAHVIEILSAIGRPCLDFYVVRLGRTPEEFQIDAVLSALEEMRQDGLIRFQGISCEGHPLATLGTWQFHDAFEVLFVPDDQEAFQNLSPLARQRRVGVVVRGAEAGSYAGAARLVEVRSPDEIALLRNRM